MVATTAKRMTVEEFLSLPEDGVRRSLIRGVVREEGMTIRNRFHTQVATRVAKFLDNWRDRQAEPRGVILTGEAGVRLAADVVVGADVVYVPGELWAAQPARATIIEGVPPLIVEILSPSDTHEAIEDKIGVYLGAGVQIVWVVNTRAETVTIYRPGHRPILVNADQQLTAEAVLPGFSVAVADLFR